MKKECKNCAHCEGGYCVYILHTERRRPCPASDGCEVWEADHGQYEDNKKPPAPRACKMDDLGAKALELYNAGLTDIQIAADLGVSSLTVLNWRRRMNLPTKYHGRRRKLSDDEAMRLYKKGLTDRQIAHLTGTYFKTVANWRYRNGLPANKKRSVEVEA